MFILENFDLILSKRILLRNINLNPTDKGLYFIVGPSGGGKTTFAKVIYVLSKILKVGESVELKFSREFKKYFSNNFIFNGKFKKKKDYLVGFAYQNFNLIDDLTVKDNIYLFKKVYDLSWYRYLLKYFEIQNLENVKVNNLSGGEKARITLIKALINKPKLLLIDETDSFLNYRLRNKLYKFLENYSDNNLVFLITHNFYFEDVKNNFAIVKKK